MLLRAGHIVRCQGQISKAAWLYPVLVALALEQVWPALWPDTPLLLGTEGWCVSLLESLCHITPGLPCLMWWFPGATLSTIFSGSYSRNLLYLWGLPSLPAGCASASRGTLPLGRWALAYARDFQQTQFLGSGPPGWGLQTCHPCHVSCCLKVSP